MTTNKEDVYGLLREALAHNVELENKLASNKQLVISLRSNGIELLADNVRFEKENKELKFQLRKMSCD